MHLIYKILKKSNLQDTKEMRKQMIFSRDCQL